MITTAAGRGPVFDHPGLFYRDATGYLDAAVPFVRAGLAADEPVMVAVPAANLDLIRAAAGADASRVVWHDMSRAGRNPGRIIGGVLLAFAAAHPGRRVRIIGEPIWPGRTATEYPACAEHEALINRAFAGRDATILCPYDTRRLKPHVIADAARTHPVITTGGRTGASPQYGDPAQVAASFNLPLARPPAAAATLTVDLAHIRAARALVADRGGAAGLRTDTIADLQVAVTELATNAIRHGVDGVGHLAVWADRTHLICQMRSRGHLDDPLVGRTIPPNDGESGRGLLLVHALCDLVRVHNGEHEVTINLYTDRP